MPRLAAGLELIGEYEGSGFKETPYLARRMDGQVLQLTRLLYLVAEATDGERDFGGIAEQVTEKFGRTVSADNIKFLVEKKLRPLGVLAAADGSSPRLKKADPMLALKLRTRLVPERAVRAVTTLFYPLFHWPVVLAVLGGLVALDAWLFFVHGVAQSAREIVYQPALFLMVFGLVVVSAAFHECGHATACRFGGAKPGAMGAGIYLVYPAFFSDVTDVYRLGKWGRIRTDLGGIYFNMIFSLLTAGAYFLTGFEPLLAIIVIQHLEMLHQLMPFLRLDGYYVVSDVTGVPDLFSRIKPILRSLLPWREPDPSVTALKPWVRVVVTAWVLSVVPLLLYILAVMVMAAPRLLATAWDSLSVRYEEAANAISAGEILAVIADAIQMIFLVLPLAGLTYTFGLIGKRLGVAAWTKTEGRPALRAGFASAAFASFGLLTLAWWPGELYEPIQPGERGTVQESLETIGDTVQESLETVEENLPNIARTGLASEQEEEGSSSGIGVGDLVRRSTGLTPAGEGASNAQQGEQDAATRQDSPTGPDASGPTRRIDKPAGAGEQPSDARQEGADKGGAGARPVPPTGTGAADPNPSIETNEGEEPNSPVETYADGPTRRIDRPEPEYPEAPSYYAPPPSSDYREAPSYYAPPPSPDYPDRSDEDDSDDGGYSDDGYSDSDDSGRGSDDDSGYSGSGDSERGYYDRYGGDSGGSDSDYSGEGDSDRSDSGGGSGYPVRSTGDGGYSERSSGDGGGYDRGGGDDRDGGDD